VELVGAEQNQFVFELGEEAAVPVTIESEVRKLSLQLQMPTLEEQGDCLSRTVGQLLLNGIDFESLGPRIPPDLLARIPSAVQAGQRLVTVTFDHDGLVEIEPGDTREQLYGIAIVLDDTLAARLIDLNTGERLAWIARLNSQSSLGADVVNRIEYSRNNHGGLEALQRRVLDDLYAMVEEALKEAGVAARHVGQIALVGNPTMTHLLLAWIRCRSLFSLYSGLDSFLAFSGGAAGVSPGFGLQGVDRPGGLGLSGRGYSCRV
jgi:hypothetical protein